MRKIGTAFFQRKFLLLSWKIGVRRGLKGWSLIYEIFRQSNFQKWDFYYIPIAGFHLENLFTFPLRFRMLVDL